MSRHKRDDKYVPALQLLMGDMDSRDRFLTYQAAFTDSMVFFSTASALEFERRMQIAYNLCREAMERTQPSSGLGAVAVQNLNSVLVDLERTFATVAADAGVILTRTPPGDR